MVRKISTNHAKSHIFIVGRQSEHEELHQKFPARGAKNVFEKAILAWCKSLVKGASHVFSIVLTADIYEGGWYGLCIIRYFWLRLIVDEDFVGTYKSYLSDGTLSDDSVVQSLTEAIEAIKLQYNGSDESCSVDQPYADAVVTLLECRIALFNLYRSLDEWVLRSIRFAVASRRAQTNDENDNKSGSKKKGDVMEDISNSDDIAAGLQNLLRIAKHAERAVATIQVNLFVVWHCSVLIRTVYIFFCTSIARCVGHQLRAGWVQVVGGTSSPNVRLQAPTSAHDSQRTHSGRYPSHRYGSRIESP